MPQIPFHFYFNGMFFTAFFTINWEHVWKPEVLWNFWKNIKVFFGPIFSEMALRFRVR